MPISQKIRRLVDNAWVDGYPCLLATAGPDGPNISPKGSIPSYSFELEFELTGVAQSVELA